MFALRGEVSLSVDDRRKVGQPFAMKLAAVIHSGSDILGGTPVFVSTRVPGQSLFDHLEAGDSIDDFLEGFPSVRRDQVIAVFVVTAYLTDKPKAGDDLWPIK